MKRVHKRFSIRKLISPIFDMAFPPVCACCGLLLIERGDTICDDCLQTRFERDMPDEGIILPDTVSFRFSMWRFDKMGYLQDLLHKLKYDHLTGVGLRLGKQIGRELARLDLISPDDLPVLVPVPLHQKRFRKRGYNQSRELAIGIAGGSGWDVIPAGSVIRRKNTRTQTGLNSSERVKNLEGAFGIKMPECVQGRTAIIVDDVYTTGATTFELARCISENSERSCGIVTIART